MFDDFGWGGGQYRRLEARIDRLERMVIALLDHFDVPYDDKQALEKLASERVLELVRSGQTIEAIKQYRQDTGAGLAEAKDVVDKLRRS